MLFVCFCLAVIGLSHIVVDSHIVEKLKRKWFYEQDERGEWKVKELTPVQAEIKYMLDCYQCSGFWCGLALGIVMNPLSVEWWWLIPAWLVCGFVGSFLSPVGASLINYLNLGGK